MGKHNSYRCNDCGRIFEKKYHKIKHRREHPNGSCNIIIREEKNKMFKKEKGKPTAPPVDDDFEDVEVDDEEEDELEEIEAETKKIKKEIARRTVEKVAKESLEKIEAPIEEPVEEELTEEKVKQILINFETRLQKIEYHLRI